MCNPMKRVPPRMRMSSGSALRGAGLDWALRANAGNTVAAAPAAAIWRSVRRFISLSCLPRSGWRVGCDPVAHRLVPEQRILRLQHPVILVGEVHQLGGYTALLQDVEQLDALEVGHAHVHAVVDDER